MKLVIMFSVFLFAQLSAHADLGGYLESRIAISTINGPWENYALMVIQIGIFRGKKSTQIDSIIRKKNGDLILIRDQFEKASSLSAEWEISRKSIKCIKSLDGKELAMLADAAPIGNLQNKIKAENASSISSVQRYMHVYTPEKKWVAYDLVTFPALDNNPKVCEEWEQNFSAAFKCLSELTESVKAPGS